MARTQQPSRAEVEAWIQRRNKKKQKIESDRDDDTTEKDEEDSESDTCSKSSSSQKKYKIVDVGNRWDEIRFSFENGRQVLIKKKDNGLIGMTGDGVSGIVFGKERNDDNNTNIKSNDNCSSGPVDDFNKRHLSVEVDGRTIYKEVRGGVTSIEIEKNMNILKAKGGTTMIDMTNDDSVHSANNEVQSESSRKDDGDDNDDENTVTAAPSSTSNNNNEGKTLSQLREEGGWHLFTNAPTDNAYEEEDNGEKWYLMTHGGKK